MSRHHPPAALITDRRFHEQIEQTVDEVERRTSAEVVVVLARVSGSYRDADFLAGMIVAVLLLAVMIFIPVTVHELIVIPNAVAGFFAGALLSRSCLPVRRALTSSRRRRQHVAEQAKIAFHDEGIRATRERNGVLIYISLLEGEVEILVDIGIEGRIERAAWNGIRHRMLRPAAEGWRAAILTGLRECGDLLAERFPPHADNPDEIPNPPRLRK